MTTLNILDNDSLAHSCSTIEENMPQPKIFIFKSNVTFHFAQQKAEEAKKKALLNNIFYGGEIKKAFNLFKGKNDVVYQDIYEYRLEPFWFIEGAREIEYNKKQEINIQINNNDATHITLLDQQFEINPVSPCLTLEGTQICLRKVEHSFYKNGMDKEINEEHLSTYLTKFGSALIEIPIQDTKKTAKKIKSLKDANNQEPIRLDPTTQLHQIETQMKEYLLNQKVDGKVTSDKLIINKINIYFRPIFAFKYKWLTDNSDVIIEVDALTGDVVTNGNWFKDKINKAITAETAQDILIGIGFDTMNKIIPFSGIAAQAIYKKVKE